MHSVGASCLWERSLEQQWQQAGISQCLLQSSAREVYLHWPGRVLVLWSHLYPPETVSSGRNGAMLPWPMAVFPEPFPWNIIGNIKIFFECMLVGGWMAGKINRSMEGGKKRRNGRAIQRHTWKEEQGVKRRKGGWRRKALTLYFLKNAAWSGVHHLLL